MILTLWWTTKPAAIRLLNREPRRVDLEDTRDPPATARWVALRGLELSLDRRLLLRAAAPTLPPLPFLLDEQSAPARWWIETRAQADLYEGLPATGALGGAVGALGVQSRGDLIRRFARLEGDAESFLPPPERALLIQYPDSGFGLAPEAPRPAEQSDADRFRRELGERIALVRQRVRAGRVEGVLDPIPKVVGTRITKELDVAPAPYLLQVGIKPSELETRLFTGAAVLLVFLVAGLWGAASAERDPDGAAGDAPASDGEAPSAQPAPERPAPAAARSGAPDASAAGDGPTAEG
ncbi:MAG: hypothetical protein AB7N76_36635 [Planctomycetota bacterium]